MYVLLKIAYQAETIFCIKTILDQKHDNFTSGKYEGNCANISLQPLKLDFFIILVCVNNQNAAEWKEIIDEAEHRFCFRDRYNLHTSKEKSRFINFNNFQQSSIRIAIARIFYHFQIIAINYIMS